MKPSLYRVGPVLGIETGSDDSAFYAPDIFVSGAISSELFSLVQKCKEFKTLHEHAADCWASLSFRQKLIHTRPIGTTYSELYGSIILGRNAFIKMLEGIFAKLAEKGCFIAETALVEIIKKTERRSVPGIQSLGVITCNRVDNLKTNLESYMKNTSTFSKKVDFVVCDDSRDEEMRLRNQAVASECALKFGCSVFYIGMNEKRLFADHLIKKGISSEVVEFALFDTDNSNYSYGANCNSFYLHTAGELTFVTDDDTICQIHPSLDYREGLAIGAVGHITPHYYFKDRQSALQSCPTKETDLLELHQSVLGRSISECASEVEKPERLQITDISPTSLSQLLRGTGRICLSHNGLLGDSGSNSPKAYLFSMQEQRRRLLKDEKTYRSIFKSRETLKVAPRLILNPAGVCMSTFYGADNREPLPPFFPIHRDCDSLFGEMLASCNHDNYFAYLPWALLHSPPEERTYQGARAVMMEGFGTTDIIRSALRSFDPHPGSRKMSENIKKSGEHLIQFGTIDFKEYRKTLAESLFRKRCEDLKNLQLLNELHSDSPDYWKKDIEAIISESKKQLGRTMYLSHPAQSEKFGAEVAEKMNQIYIRRFGELCRDWPEIFKISLDLKNSGIRLGRKIA